MSTRENQCWSRRSRDLQWFSSDDNFQCYRRLHRISILLHWMLWTLAVGNKFCTVNIFVMSSVIKYLSLLLHSIMLESVVFSEDLWDTLSKQCEQAFEMKRLIQIAYTYMVSDNMTILVQWFNGSCYLYIHVSYKT